MALNLGFFTSCSKWMGGIINAIFMICGILLILLGGLALTRQSLYKDFIENGFTSIPSLIIFVGFLLFATYLLGCQGACRENYRLLIAFSAMLSLIFMLEIGSAIAAYVLRNNLQAAVNSTVVASFKEYNSNNETKAIWNELQTDLKCCGPNGAKDYITLLNVTIPESCCNVPHCNTNNMNLINDFSCIGAIGNAVRNNIATVGGFVLAVALIQIFGILWSILLVKNFRAGYESV